MPPENQNSILSDDELQAAIAEIEQSPDAAAAIPDLDDGSRDEVVHIPANEPKRSDVKPQAAPETGGEREDEATAGDAEQAEAAGGGLDIRQTLDRVWRSIVDFVDMCLDLINQPFSWLGAAARDAIGWIALATILVSITMVVLGPYLLKTRTAFDFVQEKRAELSAPRTAETQTAASE